MTIQLEPAHIASPWPNPLSSIYLPQRHVIKRRRLTRGCVETILALHTAMEEDIKDPSPPPRMPDRPPYLRVPRLSIPTSLDMLRYAPGLLEGNVGKVFSGPSLLDGKAVERFLAGWIESSLEENGVLTPWFAASIEKCIRMGRLDSVSTRNAARVDPGIRSHDPGI